RHAQQFGQRPAGGKALAQQRAGAAAKAGQLRAGLFQHLVAGAQPIGFGFGGGALLGGGQQRGLGGAHGLGLLGGVRLGLHAGALLRIEVGIGLAYGGAGALLGRRQLPQYLLLLVLAGGQVGAAL